MNGDPLHDDRLDDALEMTFPASDPVAVFRNDKDRLPTLGDADPLGGFDQDPQDR